jgi:hypothetical protein
VSLIQNVINFLLGLSIPISIGLFAYAGILYFTSASNQGNISKAKGIFSSALIGLIIALGAYLIVETVLHAILKQEFFDGWNTVKCVNQSQRNTTAEISQVFNNAISGFSGNVTLPGPVDIPVPANTGSGVGNTGVTYNTGPMPSVGSGFCSPSNLTQFGSGARAMSCILNAESSCNNIIAGDAGFSIGLAQINMTANPVVCRGQLYNCPSAFSAPYTGSNHNVSIINPALADQCRTMLQNPSCNLETALYIYDRSGFRPWSTAAKCGV